MNLDYTYKKYNDFTRPMEHQVISDAVALVSGIKPDDLSETSPAEKVALRALFKIIRESYGEIRAELAEDVKVNANRLQ